MMKKKVRGRVRFLLLWLLLRRRNIHDDDFILGRYSLILDIVIFLPPVLSSTFLFLCFLQSSFLAIPVSTACLTRSNLLVRHHSSSQNARPSSRSQDPPKHFSTPRPTRRLATPSFPLPCTSTMELVTSAATFATENTHTPPIFDFRQDPDETPSHSC